MSILKQFERQLQEADPSLRVAVFGSTLVLLDGDHETPLTRGERSERDGWMSQRLIPEISDALFAFPIIERLPCPAPELSALPRAFREHHDVACHAAQHLMFTGSLDGFTLRTRLPITQAQGDRILRLVLAHLRCFGYRHEHKVAWAGVLLDRWFRITALPVTETAEHECSAD